MKLMGSIAVCVLLLAVSAPASAQSGPEITEGTAVSNAGSVLLPATPERLDFWNETQPAIGPGAAASIAMQQDRRSGATWLLVGAALIGAGLIIDGDAGTALSVGGALLGAYGVFLMVRR
jgi:hypothetical protein